MCYIQCIRKVFRPLDFFHIFLHYSLILKCIKSFFPPHQKHPHSMRLPPPCFIVGIVPGFRQTWYLAFRPKSSTLFSSDQRILLLMVWGFLGAFWINPSGLSCAFYWGVASVWPLYHKGLIGGVLQRWLSFWKVLRFPQRNSRALSEWPSGLPSGAAVQGTASQCKRGHCSPWFESRLHHIRPWLGVP